MIPALLVVGCGALSAALTWTVREVALRTGLLDRPNDRSAHVRPTPRLGGIGIVVTWLGAAAYVVHAHGAQGRTLLVLGATAAIALLGLWDDLRPLRARTRLSVQLLAATAVVVSAWQDVPSRWSLLGGGAPDWLLAALSVLWLTWLTNLYNFMDGIDGLAGGQAVLAAGSLAVAAAASGAQLSAWLLVALAASSAGFLRLNFPPATIFMGDVGSTAIGFFLGAVPFLPGPGAVPVEAVAIALSLFILDATITLFRRLARGERVFQAHRTHFYQRPLAAGVPHRRITVVAYAGMAAVGCAAAATPAFGVAGRWLLVAGAAGVFGLLVSLVVRLERRAGERPAPVGRGTLDHTS